MSKNPYSNNGNKPVNSYPKYEVCVSYWKLKTQWIEYVFLDQLNQYFVQTMHLFYWDNHIFFFLLFVIGSLQILAMSIVFLMHLYVAQGIRYRTLGIKHKDTMHIFNRVHTFQYFEIISCIENREMSVPGARIRTLLLSVWFVQLYFSFLFSVLIRQIIDYKAFDKFNLFEFVCTVTNNP